MLINMKCKKHPGCLYDVLCNCDNCDNFTREIFLNIWKRFANSLTQKALLLIDVG